MDDPSGRRGFHKSWGKRAPARAVPRTLDGLIQFFSFVGNEKSRLERQLRSARTIEIKRDVANERYSAMRAGQLRGFEQSLNRLRKLEKGCLKKAPWRAMDAHLRERDEELLFDALRSLVLIIGDQKDLLINGYGKGTKAEDAPPQLREDALTQLREDALNFALSYPGVWPPRSQTSGAPILAARREGAPSKERRFRAAEKRATKLISVLMSGAIVNILRGSGGGGSGVVFAAQTALSKIAGISRRLIAKARWMPLFPRD